MITLCIDIGLRNLSLCIMNSNFEILFWEVYNVLDSDNYRCPKLLKDGKICDKKCSLKYQENNAKEDVYTYTCKIHFPKDIEITKNHRFHSKNINEYPLQEIAEIFLSKIQSIYDANLELFKNLDSINIELQMQTNKKAMFISHILYGKFIDLYKDNPKPIRFVRASQKLKIYDGPEISCPLKNEYAKRKWLGIEHMKWFLNNHFSEEQRNQWISWLSKHTKQDDLCDSGLMAINAITTKKKSTK